ncbi:hypothetical protein C8R47DRAFT_1069137 [Mycena vitilis]|nr:hypothetical protein C8R47DRAFT_1069137 [Mycena vitilis]
MPPKRTRQSSAEPDATAKRARLEAEGAAASTATSAPLSPVSEMSDVESESGTVVNISGTPSIQESPDVGNAATVAVSPSIPSAMALSPRSVAPAVASDRLAGTESAAPPSNEPRAESIAGCNNEIEAIKILSILGVEPGALAGVSLPTLNAIIQSMTKSAAAKRVPTTDLQAAVAPAGVEHTQSATVYDPSGGAHGPEMTNAVNALVDIGVAANRLSGWTIAEMKRLRIILRWSDEKRRVYNIDSAHLKLDWGVPAPFNNTSNVLCVAGTPNPVTFWITGEVSSQFWVDQEGWPHMRPAISVQPLIDCTTDFCRTQLNELCMPIGSCNPLAKLVDLFGPAQVKASRWMTERATKGQPAKTIEFKAVYDARKTLRDKTLLQQLNVGQLKLRDFVVLEVQVGRYATKDEGTSDVKGKKRNMDRWQSFYDLQAVYKFKDAIQADDAAPVVADFEI